MEVKERINGGKVTASTKLNNQRIAVKRPAVVHVSIYDSKELLERSDTHTHGQVSHIHRHAFRAISERYRSFSRTVRCAEEVHARDDEGSAGGAAGEEGQACEELEDAHEWKGEEKEVSPADCIDELDGRERKDKVDDPEAHGAEEGLVNCVAGGLEDEARKVGEDIDLGYAR